jgi:hypothetical protein
MNHRSDQAIANDQEDRVMLPKRLTMLMLSATLALSTVAFTAPVATADEGHPSIVVQAVIALEDIAAATNYYKKANLSVGLMKDIRHWVSPYNHHGTGPYGVPLFVTKIDQIGTGTCSAATEYQKWLLETRSLARVGFRYFRGKATNWQEFPSGDRAAARVRQMLVFNRIEGRQADAQKAFLNCIFDKMPMQLRLLLF